MKSIMLISVVGALLGLSSLTVAQDSPPPGAPASTETPTPVPSGPDASPAASSAAEQTPVPTAAPTAEPAEANTSPAANAPVTNTAEPAETAATRKYEPLPPKRYVLLRPVARPVRRREPRRYGDAGAPFSLGIGATMLWPSDRGYRVAGMEDTQGHFDVFASYDVFQPHKRFVVAAGGSFRTLGGADADGVDLAVRTVQADLVGRYQLLSWLWPHVRASLGASFTKMRVEDVVDELGRPDVVYEGSDRSLAGTLGAGFTVRTKARTFETYRGRLSSLSVGVMVEGGYVVAQRADLDLEPNDDATRNIATRAAPMGSLDLTAPYLRLTAVTRF